MLSCMLLAPSIEKLMQCIAGGIFLPNTPNSLVELGILVANKVMENMENPWRAIVRSAFSAHSHLCTLFTLPTCRA